MTDFNIPILLLTYNRPELLERVFEQVAKIRPEKIYVVSDGPKNDEDALNIERSREFLSLKSREFTIIQLNRNENLGCRESVSSGISWFFDQEEMGIILEDDCLPSESFFNYCAELLNRYKNDERIYSISGFNQQNEWKTKNADYFFSSLGNCWGWASWRRCWKDYDVDIKDFNEFVNNNGFENSLGSHLGEIKHNMIHNGVIKNASDSWALQWGYLRHKNHGLTCIPSKSLIKNIGFGKDATHTKGHHPFENVIANEITFPLKENFFIVPDMEYDNLMFKRENLLNRFFQRIWRVFN